MKRRDFLKTGSGFGLILLLNPLPYLTASEPSLAPLIKTPDQWREILAPERYRILFEEATESSWSSSLNLEKRPGMFICAACFLPLFSSINKYDSKTGWPSFWRPFNQKHIGTKRDFKLILPRTEYHCNRCKGHQGHVFKDGPQPTGLRYCNNGLALLFIPDNQPLPELRT